MKNRNEELDFSVESTESLMLMAILGPANCRSRAKKELKRRKMIQHLSSVSDWFLKAGLDTGC